MSKPVRLTEENIERLLELHEDINTAIEMLLDKNTIQTDYFEICGQMYRQRISKGALGWVCEITPVKDEPNRR